MFLSFQNSFKRNWTPSIGEYKSLKSITFLCATDTKFGFYSYLSVSSTSFSFRSFSWFSFLANSLACCSLFKRRFLAAFVSPGIESPSTLSFQSQLMSFKAQLMSSFRLRHMPSFNKYMFISCRDYGPVESERLGMLIYTNYTWLSSSDLWLSPVSTNCFSLNSIPIECPYEVWVTFGNYSDTMDLRVC